MMHVLWVLFGWPNGIVVGNLLANVIWGVPAVLHLKKHIRKGAEK